MRPAPETTSSTSTTYPAARIFLALVAVSAVIVLAGLSMPWWAPTHEVAIYLDVANEVSLPTWWNTALLVVAGVLMLAVAGATSLPRGRVAWRLLGSLVVLMSLDEASMLHERLALVGLHWWPEAGLNYMWLLLGVPLAVAVAVSVALASRGLPARARWAVLGAFGLYFAGALGAELAQEFVLRTEAHWFVRPFLSHLEEGLEMTGAALLLVTPLAGLHRPRLVGDDGPGEAPAPPR
ncbi:MAG: hypothetical protein ACOC84_10550 [Actinomycetota bacterium]